MEKFSYLKEGEESPSTRTLHAVSKPGNVSALDLSGLSEEDANKAARLYDQWQLEHVKPYSALERQFKKDNLKPWETFAAENGLADPPIVKSFKPQGLTKIV